MLAKHCTILNINCYKELNHCEMQGAIYFKIVIWGPSYSWLEWTKKPAGDNLPPKMFCTVFPLKKNICLACLWGKNILPLRNLPPPQMLCQIWHNIYQVKYETLIFWIEKKTSQCKIWSSYQLPTMRGVYPCLEKALFFGLFAFN